MLGNWDICGQPADRDRILSMIQPVTDLSQAAQDCDVVIEAVPERIELKRGIFEQLGNSLGADVLLATNTSSLPVSDIAAVTVCYCRIPCDGFSL